MEYGIKAQNYVGNGILDPKKSDIWDIRLEKACGIWDIWPENFWDMGYLGRKHLGYGILEPLCHLPRGYSN